jgi:ATP-dependent RNA helicase DeaD
MKDRERLLAQLTAPVDLVDEVLELAQTLMKQLEPEAIAAALVRSLQSDMPAAEDILGPRERQPRGAAVHREGVDDASWFRMNAGRRHNADPRWLLPLICRYGHVGRNEVGAIRIAANESYFQISGRATPGFLKALRRATISPEDEGLVIEPAPPRDQPPPRDRGPARQSPESRPGYRPEQARAKPRAKKKPSRRKLT